MKQELKGMTQTMNVATKASRLDDDEVTIAADDAGATAASQKIGKVLETERPEVASETPPLIGGHIKDAASEHDREKIRQARENAQLTDDIMGEGRLEDR
ncbi:MAG: hypothetical protein AB7G25_10130 [Sphingomonadaceae bacterium]